MAKRQTGDADELVTLDALKPDTENRRRHTTRNVDMITASLREVGSARSIVIDEDNIVRAGNGVMQAAPGAGISKVKIVDVDGDTLVAVRRRGLTDEQKRALAIYDNRTAELAEWNVEQLQLDADAGLELKPFFSDDEVSKLFGTGGPTEFRKVDVNVSTEYRCPSCGYSWSGKAKTESSEPAS